MKSYVLAEKNFTIGVVHLLDDAISNAIIEEGYWSSEFFLKMRDNHLQ